jgi:PAS domain S-box-containing protein
MSGSPSDDDIESIALAFDGDDEDTSPEVVRHHAAKVGAVVPDNNPLVVIACADAGLRRELVELLWTDGWSALEAKTPDELSETVRAMGPHVALVDANFTGAAGMSAPEMIRNHRPDTAIRVVALLQSASTDEVATAVVDGFDDFVMNPTNHVEVLARATANLRASRTVGEMHAQSRNLASLLELSQTLASSLDLQLILHTVSRLIAGVIHVDRCSIILLDPEGRDAVVVAASEDRDVRDLRIQIDSYPELKRCVDSAAPVLIEDAAADPLLEHVREQVISIGVRVMALFPIVFEERVMGVLFLRSGEAGRRLTDHEVQFGQTVASACAVAVRNARLFDSFRDQTERMNYMRLVAERQMEALKKYEDFFEYAADGMAIVDTEGEVLYANREGRQLLGRSQEEVRGANFTEFLADESRDAWPEIIDQVRVGRFRKSFDLFVVRGDRSEAIFWLSAGGVGQDTGLIILSFRDVTETREMELELRTTKDFLENLIDNSVDAIVASDMSGNIMLFNKGAEKIYGYQAEDVVGHLHVNDLYPEDVSNEVMMQLRDERWGGRGRLDPTRKRILNAEGEAVPVNMTASIIYEDGDEVATVGVFTDLRDRLQMEQRLSEAEEELMKTERARVAAELAGMAAHELNQPLTSVLGYAEMLKHRIDQENKRVAKVVDTIYEQAERMAEIVRKIGRITKYETKHYGARTMMMDLDRSTADDGGGEPAEPTDKHRAIRPGDSDESDRATGRFKAYPSAGHGDDDEVTGPTRKQPKGDSARLMAHLASHMGRPGGVEQSDPHGLIVRPDTIDEPPLSERRKRRDTEPKMPKGGGGGGGGVEGEVTMRQMRAPGPGGPPLKSAGMLDKFDEDSDELNRTQAGYPKPSSFDEPTGEMQKPDDD